MSVTGQDQARSLRRYALTPCASSYQSPPPSPSPSSSSSSALDGEPILPSSFWRYYSSDQKRAVDTFQLAFGIENKNKEKEKEGDYTTTTNNDRNNNISCVYGKKKDDGEESRVVIMRGKNSGNNDRKREAVAIQPRLDARLREVAKGTREGKPKGLSYEECEALNHYAITNAPSPTENTHSIIPVVVPLLESKDDVWDRTKGWLDEVLDNACQEYREDSRIRGSRNYHSREEDCAITSPSFILSSPSSSSSSSSTTSQRRRFDVVTVSHSGTLQIMIEKLVGLQKKIIVPNTSVTIIEMTPKIDVDFVGCQNSTRIIDTFCANYSSSNDNDLGVVVGDMTTTTMKPISPKVTTWRSKLILLTNTNHLMTLS